MEIASPDLQDARLLDVVINVIVYPKLLAQHHHVTTGRETVVRTGNLQPRT
jgi:hypothetical protein